MEELKRCTYTMRPDHIELLNEISERYALRSRSAALAFLIEEYKRHEKIQAVKDAYHAAQARRSIYVDTDSIKEFESVDKSLCMYDHAADILKGDNDNE